MLFDLIHFVFAVYISNHIKGKQMQISILIITWLEFNCYQNVIIIYHIRLYKNLVFVIYSVRVLLYNMNILYINSLYSYCIEKKGSIWEEIVLISYYFTHFLNTWDSYVLYKCTYQFMTINMLCEVFSGIFSIFLMQYVFFFYSLFNHY